MSAAAVALAVVWTVNGVSAAPPIRVGANLRDYKRPRNKDCTFTVPNQFSTIQSAVDAASEGATICVDAGTYFEDVVIDKSIRLAGDGAMSSAIVGQGFSASVIVAADNVVVEGLLINGVGADYTAAGMIISEGRTNVTVRSNRILASSGALALRADGAQSNHVIQNNVLEGNNSPQILLISGQPSVAKPSNGIAILDNTFIGTVVPTPRDDSGVAMISEAADNVLSRNLFEVSGTVHELAHFGFASNVVTYNNFNTDTFSPLTGTPVKLRAGFEGTTSAENNWWGDLDPSDNIQGDVDAIPFATTPFKQNNTDWRQRSYARSNTGMHQDEMAVGDARPHLEAPAVS
jgi:hypothetical protein